MTQDKYQFTPTAANHVALSPVSFIKRTALMYPDHDALIYGTRRYSWGEVYTRCRRLASALGKHGIGRGDTVAILAANTPEMIEAHFAVPMSGAVLNTINTRLDSETIRYILEHGEAKVFIVDGALAPNARDALAALDHDILVIDILDEQGDQPPSALGDTDYEAFVQAGDPNADWQMPNSELDAISLNYTSGTSGRPKGVVSTHRGAYLTATGVISDWGLPRHPKYLYTVPLFHCNGWCHAWAMAALAGTMICTRAITPAGIFAAIDQYKISHFGGAPIILGMLLNAPEKVKFDHKIEVMTAGAPPPAAVLQGIEDLGFNVTQVYGLTETFGHTVMSSWNSNWDALEPNQKSSLKARQGAAMVHADGVRVLDDLGEDVPADGVSMGQIFLRGNSIMAGYLKNPDATADAFANGWFASGDLAVMHENGYIEVKDRLKDIIISGGENISSVEIEGVLHRHAAVAFAAVVAKPDEKWGEVPCAFIELKENKSADAEEIITFCRRHLAGFKRPKHIVFGELPKTATGKIQKYELRKRV
ncbi:acyl-CoA synthetase [Amylibacter marinus]|uniref:Acyl-CoA synthetase n=1 Tax=Amylibacter marinus TaxID=1475483 RepID=A0ABQ5VV64_9RHOB|nr:AMP-binding protein [Amylibacter marinus]GLQ34978.1 acyl-CoA synthetase [Amylibacter marinus]